MLIAFTGLKQSGKDTAAKYLIDNYGFIKKSFAEPIKEACKIIFDWTEDYVNGSLKEVVDGRYGISPRQALQNLGTEWGQYGLCEYPEFLKTTGRLLWVNRFKFWYLQNKDKNIVLTDLRFPHELKVLNELGAITIRIERFAENKDLHESEKYIMNLPVDISIKNDSTIKNLHNKIENILSIINKE